MPDLASLFDEHPGQGDLDNSYYLGLLVHVRFIPYDAATSVLSKHRLTASY